MNENNLTDEELEQLEVEQNKSKQIKDKYDVLEELRLLLNSSKIEQMNYFHTHSPKGRTCHYYLKSKQIFERDEKEQILNLMNKLLTEEFKD